MSKGVHEKRKLGASHKGNTHSGKGQVAMQLVWENLPIEHAYKNHFKSNCIKRYEEEEEITPQMIVQAEMMVTAQAQNLIQGLNTPIPTVFPEGEGAESEQSEDSVLELSY